MTYDKNESVFIAINQSINTSLIVGTFPSTTTKTNSSVRILTATAHEKFSYCINRRPSRPEPDYKQADDLICRGCSMQIHISAACANITRSENSHKVEIAIAAFVRNVFLRTDYLGGHFSYSAELHMQKCGLCFSTQKALGEAIAGPNRSRKGVFF
jgi:hypothetical protein